VDAFEPLVRRYQKVLYNVAWRLLGSREDARDVVQGAFVKAWSKLETFDPRHRFFSWIYRIVVNESLNARSRRPSLQALGGFDAAASGGPEEALRSRERNDRLQKAMLRLSAEDREVIVLRHFAELSYSEIGETLGLAEKTVKSRLHEARQRLGRALRSDEIR
jgi:RNA polymerase sigma-70 factor (ECF subfamily)